MTLPSYGDTPDFERTLSSSATTQSFDTGEDTTRLLMGGGSNSRSGRWLWATGFESGLGEFVYGSGSGKIYTDKNVGEVYQGAASLGLLTNAALPDLLWVQKSLYSPFNSESTNQRVGMEVMVNCLAMGGVPFEVMWQINFPVSSVLTYQFRIVLVSAGAGNGNLYWDNNGVRTLLKNINPYVTYVPGTGFGQYHYTKFVVDGKTGKYVKFIFDNLIFDMTLLPGFFWATPTTGLALEFRVQFQTFAPAGLRQLTIDNWVMTADEP